VNGIRALTDLRGSLAQEFLCASPPAALAPLATPAPPSDRSPCHGIRGACVLEALPTGAVLGAKQLARIKARLSLESACAISHAEHLAHAASATAAARGVVPLAQDRLSGGETGGALRRKQVVRSAWASSRYHRAVGRPSLRLPEL
tara:strand:- start:102 stop:539 length:438 start_codon:yes stop_codon:yes gene_type:complete